MDDLLALSARALDGDTTVRTNRTGGQLSEVAPGVAMIEAFGHVVVFRTSAGLVLFDTSAAANAERVVPALRAWDAAPVHTIVYTHGHIDHVGGARAVFDDATARGYGRPRVIAHENLPRRFERYDRTNGYNAIINARQFAPTRQADFQQARFFSDWVLPDTTFQDRMSFSAGDLRFELHHAKGETDDHLWAWVPSLRAVCSGDLITWVFPNAGNPQKVQRYPVEWAAALREMASLEPELLLPAHGLPIGGRERVAGVLETIASALESLVSQTLNLMNRGARLDEVLSSVRLPDDVLAKPFLLPVYDEPEFVVRNIWRMYGGWYDGNPAHLKPAPEAAVSVEVARLAGGALALARRGQEVAAEGDLRLACQLVEWAARADPENAEVHAARAAVYDQRRGAEQSLMARGIYGSAAAESRKVAGGE